MICLHGFGGDKESSVIAAMAEDLIFPCTIFAFDWPAHGESTAADNELTVENCLKDLDAVVKFLQKTEPKKRLSCFATSFGGYIATLYRNAHPDVFEHFILRSPALKMYDVACGLLDDAEYTTIQNGGQVAMGFGRKMCLGKAFFASLRANPAFEEPMVNPLKTMVMQGDRDDVVNPADIQEYCAKNCVRLILFPGTDHRYKKEGELERILECTRAFLTTSYSISDYGTIYRAADPITVDVWNEETGAWVEEKHSGKRYYDIIGRGGSWDQYSDLTVEEAWELVNRRGGTMQEFVKYVGT